jgi:hypothetical protein
MAIPLSYHCEHDGREHRKRVVVGVVGEPHSPAKPLGCAVGGLAVLGASSALQAVRDRGRPEADIPQPPKVPDRRPLINILVFREICGRRPQVDIVQRTGSSTGRLRRARGLWELSWELKSEANQIL